ncbi:DUF2203 domain-containing protein [Ammoniphilus sp. YIM 78166]|uniref:DUF2203 domain-containing protein n=1 Tax=Ammoniphilus sp. YIM 78166 TaxID=1644106 RepID=UPI00106F1676|nr:DUF2203 domain-containing protein [Ammoniphilus sp. YIM 78166]
MTQKKFFTLAEAHALLPMVIKEIDQLQVLREDYQLKYYERRIIMAKNAIDAERVFKLECELEFLEMEAQLHVNNIESKGIQLKDIDHGLIDFPALNGDEEVLLCWKKGEESIRYFHGLQDGFVGRQLIKPGQFD